MAGLSVRAEGGAEGGTWDSLQDCSLAEGEDAELKAVETRPGRGHRLCDVLFLKARWNRGQSHFEMQAGGEGGGINPKARGKGWCGGGSSLKASDRGC